ncbi:glyoxylate reductase/hydroxypyruvate reductase-like [Zerene cesonia]|uniref:glyoxylate reductase/hydroxypyruvate reductase-like n=1 Tax=Zerene cesonia TaxID=33412 RepID=UPI0018E563EF|nr:glyoxylate reductase/hydroxypyruvate reductase-like [Zerene cesonia]
MYFFRNMSQSGKFKVFITRPDMPENGVKMLKKQCDVTAWKAPLPIPRADLLKSISGVNAIFISMKDRIDGEVLDAAGHELKVVATISVGYDHIDVAECKKRGIRIGHTPGVLTDATAELTSTCNSKPSNFGHMKRITLI